MEYTVVTFSFFFLSIRLFFLLLKNISRKILPRTQEFNELVLCYAYKRLHVYVLEFFEQKVILKFIKDIILYVNEKQNV